jgi:hypothetical protein
VELLRQSLHEEQDSVIQLGHDVDAEIARVESEIALLRTQPAWINASLSSGWTNFGGSVPVSYFRDRLGFVHLRGMAVPGTVGGSGILCQLPEGYRPGIRTAPFIVWTRNTSTPADTPGRVEITTTGNVLMLTGAAIGWWGLGEIIFRAEQ